MFIAQRLPPIRKVSFLNSDRSRKSFLLSDRKSEKASTNEGRVYGWATYVLLLYRALLESTNVFFQRHSLVLGNDVPPMPDFLAHLADKADMGSSAKEKAERDARWVGDFTDELTVAIALRQWDQAVKLVEEGMYFAQFLPHPYSLATRRRETVHHTFPFSQAHTTQVHSHRCSPAIPFICSQPQIDCRPPYHSPSSPERWSSSKKYLPLSANRSHAQMYPDDHLRRIYWNVHC